MSTHPQGKVTPELKVILYESWMDLFRCQPAQDNSQSILSLQVQVVESSRLPKVVFTVGSLSGNFV